MPQIRVHYYLNRHSPDGLPTRASNRQATRRPTAFTTAKVPGRRQRTQRRNGVEDMLEQPARDHDLGHFSKTPFARRVTPGGKLRLEGYFVKPHFRPQAPLPARYRHASPCTRATRPQPRHPKTVTLAAPMFRCTLPRLGAKPGAQSIEIARHP